MKLSNALWRKNKDFLSEADLKAELEDIENQRREEISSSEQETERKIETLRKQLDDVFAILIEIRQEIHQIRCVTGIKKPKKLKKDWWRKEE